MSKTMRKLTKNDDNKSHLILKRIFQRYTVHGIAENKLLLPLSMFGFVIYILVLRRARLIGNHQGTGNQNRVFVNFINRRREENKFRSMICARRNLLNKIVFVVIRDDVVERLNDVRYYPREVLENRGRTVGPEKRAECES